MSTPSRLLGRDLLNTLCEALGITDPSVRRINIECDVHAGAVVLIERFVTSEQGKQLGLAMESFRLVPTNEHAEVERLQALNAQLTERVAAQSELLTRAAQKAEMP